MEERQLLYKNSRVHYYRFGNGPAPVFCFHGYGEAASSFLFLEKYAGDEFSFYSVDLPFHGKTDWQEGLDFTQQDLLQIIEAIFHENSANTGSQNAIFSLMGFSLGGRMALSLYQAMPNKIDKLVLLAPDGLKVNFWYWLSTQSFLGNKLFAFTMQHPHWFFGFLKILNALKLVNASIFKFVNHYIGDTTVRR
ncbi:MAG TPA: alpha/beta hydrolase, partial [Chitinophagaceae bacterium]|nr:alpha/beta hydrolase [Chitinophagaceae bacterium]